MQKLLNPKDYLTQYRELNNQAMKNFIQAIIGI